MGKHDEAGFHFHLSDAVVGEGQIISRYEFNGNIIRGV